MSKYDPTDLELMQHADGELDERGAAGVRGLLDRDPQARDRTAALGELTDLVRSHLELSADEVAERRFQAMWGEISEAVERAATHSPAQPADRDRARTAVPAGVWGRISAWFERHRGHLLTGAVSAGAVAALALILRPGDRPGDAAGPRSIINVQPVSLRSPPAIESLDTPDGTGTVLNLEDEDGHTAVIWVTPADTVEGI